MQEGNFDSKKPLGKLEKIKLTLKHSQEKDGKVLIQANLLGVDLRESIYKIPGTIECRVYESTTSDDESGEIWYAVDTQSSSTEGQNNWPGAWVDKSALLEFIEKNKDQIK